MHDTTERAMPKPRTMLRRILSHHEIATLLLLLHAPRLKPVLPKYALNFLRAQS